jgi:hypothetical protein
MTNYREPAVQRMSRLFAGLLHAVFPRYLNKADGAT